MRNPVIFAAWCACYDLRPPEDNSVEGLRPLLTARFRQPVAANTARLLLDGTDVTGSTTEQGGFLSYTPAEDLTPGRHVVQVQATDPAGRPVRREWAFMVRAVSRKAPSAGVAALDLNVTNLVQEGSAIFRVQGRTDPFAHVRATGRSSSALDRGAVRLHDTNLNGSAQADSAGEFSLQLQEPSLPVDYIITLQVTAADRG